jgi:hypothetical protein
MITRRHSMSIVGASALGLAGLGRAVADVTPTGKPDALYTEPYLDIDAWRDEPERHRYVHGGFKNTDLRFSMYFPPAERYEGRFFHPVMHIAGNENAARARLAGMDGDSIGFAFDSGGYLVESNMGSFNMRGPGDITNFRASAAAAEYSRELARKMYGGGRPYGYVYGGSGGGFKSITCVENTNGVWDGAVPFIHGSPVSLPNVFTVQAHAFRILDGKFPGIVDAISPGGGGDMYAGLNEEERAALLEVTRMGFPARAWFAVDRLSVNYTGVLASIIDDLLTADPSYYDDFWKKPGYLGFNPPESLKRARIRAQTTITQVITTAEARDQGLPVSIAAGTRASAPAAVKLASIPQGHLQGAYLYLKSGALSGRRLMVTGVVRDIVLIGFSGELVAAMQGLRPGDATEIDNSIYLATQTYHRHQNPPREYYVWDQFRKPDGSLIYPERPLVPNSAAVGPGFASQSGKFGCKMIVIENLMDEAAYPWQADWYRSKVQAALGPHFEDQYRLWFTDHAMHVNPGSYMTPNEGGATTTMQSWVDTHIISYAGILQQALRDVAAWVERGIAPPESTSYKVVDGQIVVPQRTAERKGIQPVVALTVNGGQRADIRVGQSVTFNAVAEAPSNTGSIVSAEWDFDGTGAYPERSNITPKPQISVSMTHTFNAPGTYFPAVRVKSHRNGDTRTSYALAHNLARVRVVVTA